MPDFDTAPGSKWTYHTISAVALPSKRWFLSMPPYKLQRPLVPLHQSLICV